MNKLNVLILEYQEKYRNLLSNFLHEKGCSVYTTSNIPDATGILEETAIDLVFADISACTSEGIEFLRKTKEFDSVLTVVVFASNSDTDYVIDAFQAGADDILLKPFGIPQLQVVIERSKPYSDFQNRLRTMDLNFNLVSRQLKEKSNIAIAGTGIEMKNVLNLVCKVSRSSSTTVLVTGESGTGKELVAQSIHALSTRSRNFFHSVNCSAVPETLFESEFFGHKKGAFTGATDNTPGWFEIAQHGTLFLDEISELPMNMQSKFLRVLEEKMISKIGTKKYISLDLRIIAATNQDLERMVERNAFRIDLYHRLTPFVIHVPPLRERKEDIPELINYYIKYFSKKLDKKITSIDERIYHKLQNYYFPGNVRELKNLIERAIIISDGEYLAASHIKLLNHKPDSKMERFSPQRDFDLGRIEKNVILQALSASEYNKSRASELLNISRQALDRKIQKYGIGIEA